MSNGINPWIKRPDQPQDEPPKQEPFPVEQPWQQQPPEQQQQPWPGQNQLGQQQQQQQQQWPGQQTVPRIEEKRHDVNQQMGVLQPIKTQEPPGPPAPIPTIEDIGGAPTDVQQTIPVDQTPSMDLEEQDQITPGGQMVADFWQDQFSRGEFSDVESRRRQTDTQNQQFEYMVMKTARDRASQMGLEPGTAGYEQLMRDAMSQASQKRLGSEQQINQMQRDYRDTATAQLTAEEQRAREFAIGERGFEFQRDDIIYLRDHSDDIQTQQDAEALINTIQDPKLKQALQRELLEGGPEAVKAYAAKAMDEYGTITDEHGSQGPSETSMQGFLEQAKYATEDPFTGETLAPVGTQEGDAQRNAIASKLYNANILSQQGITIEGGQEITKKQNQQKRINSFVESLDYLSMNKEDYLAMDGDQRATLREKSIDFTTMGNKQGSWSRYDDVDNDDAKNHYLANNPIAQDSMKGQSVLVGGVVYIITEPLHQRYARDNQSGIIYSMGINTETGETEIIPGTKTEIYKYTG